MFRRGGSTNTGIMSGLVDRRNYSTGMFGQGISGLTPGAGTVQLMPTEAPAAGPSPLMQALGVGLAGADIYGRIFGGRKTT